MAGTVPYDAVKSFLSEYFSGVYAVVDFDHIDDAKEQGEAAFLALEEIQGVEDVIDIGDPSSVGVMETGSIIVFCFSPAPEASSATRTIAQAVRDSLRFRTIDGVRIADPGVPDPGAVMNEGMWSAAALTIVYEHQARYAIPPPPSP